VAYRLKDGRCAIAAMRAADRADYKKIADALGVRRADLRAATVQEVETELGMQQGGIVALPINGALVVIDPGVLALGTIFCGAGRSDATLEIAAAELARVAGGTVADLVRTP
jgi:Cys-tRNA(Pro)/Cys-tRNA(Cys) deacylase